MADLGQFFDFFVEPKVRSPRSKRRIGFCLTSIKCRENSPIIQANKFLWFIRLYGCSKADYQKSWVLKSRAKSLFLLFSANLSWQFESGKIELQSKTDFQKSAFVKPQK